MSNKNKKQESPKPAEQPAKPVVKEETKKDSSDCKNALEHLQR